MKLTDEEFINLIKEAGGELKIEKGQTGGTSLADPYNYNQIRRLVKEGKLRAARVEYDPFCFHPDVVKERPWLRHYPDNKWSKPSMPSMVYVHVTLLEHDLRREVKSILQMKPDENCLMILRRKSNKKGKPVNRIVGSDSTVRQNGLLYLTKTKSSGKFYFPNHFKCNTRVLHAED